MKELKIRLVGDSPVLQHSDRLANPLLEATKIHKKLTGDKQAKKTDEGQLAIAESEFKLSLYIDEAGPYFPTTNVRAAFVEGARLSKMGKSIERGVLILEDKAHLSYAGPRDADGLWQNQKFVDVRSVKVGMSRVMRYRPKFDEWKLTVTVVYDEEVITADQLVHSIERAGKYIGLGDFRPNCGGTFGRFSVEVL